MRSPPAWLTRSRVDTIRMAGVGSVIGFGVGLFVGHPILAAAIGAGIGALAILSVYAAYNFSRGLLFAGGAPTSAQ